LDLKEVGYINQETWLTWQLYLKECQICHR